MLLATLMFLTVLIVVPTAKADSVVARIWTDKPDYSPAETVTINGSGFLANTAIYINVTRPDFSVNSWDNTTSDAEGNFTTTYLLDGITGTYTVTVTDGTNTATTTFTDTTLYEYYNTGDNSAGSFWGNYWEAQTFTVQATGHTVTSVKLKLSRGGSPGTVTVSIRATNVEGYPTGPDLTSGTINGNTLSTKQITSWCEIFLTEYALNANTKYAIVVRAPNGSSSNYLYWWADGSSPTYAGGIWEWSGNSGSSWIGVSSNDHIFEVWGNPPPSQYYLTVNSPHDTPIGSGWYDAGTTAYAKLLNGLVTSGETRWVFTGWSGDAGGTGLTSNPIIMNGPKTAVAEWKTQYKLSVIPFPLPYIDTPSGDGWYDAGSIAYASVSDYAVPDVAGCQWAFSYWTFDASGTNLTSDPILMDGPKLAVPVWDYQYLLTVQTDPAGIKTIPGQGFYELGTKVNLTAPLEVNTPDNKYLFAFWDVDGADQLYFANSIQVCIDKPHTATAVYLNYLEDAKQEISHLGTTATNLYNSKQMDKGEYEYFAKALNKIGKDIDRTMKQFDRTRYGFDDRQKGFEDLRHAVMKFESLIHKVEEWSAKGEIPASDATSIINELEKIRMKLVNKAWAEALAERALALKAIANAKELGKDTTKAEEEITKINTELDKAIQSIAEGNFAQAIQHFKHAFTHSHHAVKKAYDKTWDIDYKDWIDELEEEDP